jgi:radical SAM protein with 4Fe4S-binding SPASM domain
MLIIAWEVTAACNLACEYCRASASASPDGAELSTEEAEGFIDQVAPLRPMLILSGGEPLLRPDIFHLAEYARSRGIRVSLATNGTLLTPEAVERIKRAGIMRVSISLDGPGPEVHDASRGPGSFDLAVRGIGNLRGEVDFQINMTVTRGNQNEVSATMDLAEELGAVAFHLFFLVPTGRGREEDLVTPEEQDAILREVAGEGRRRKIEVKVTCAPQYGRVVREVLTEAEREGIMGSACLAGTNFVFVSRTGDVSPCGYLPIVAGNVREESFPEIWESSPVFLDLRRRELLGRCGGCSYRRVCGGCRARAYAATGDYLESDPLCSYDSAEEDLKEDGRTEGAPPGREGPDLDELDRRLLEIVQEEFPLTARPFLALGEALGTSEEEAMERAKRLQDWGIIRRIGPILDMRRLGCSGVLVALPVSDDRTEEVAEVVNSYQEISHNYLRPNETEFNMWFTISASEERIEEILSEMKEKTGLHQLVLPTKRIFKIGVRFEIPR